MHSESVTALLYTVNCYSVSFPIPCGHKVPIEVCKRSVGQAENIIKQERDGKSAALRQHAQPKSMSRTIKMDTLGIEPRASRMLSGCDTTTPRAPCLLRQRGVPNWSPAPPRLQEWVLARSVAMQSDTEGIRTPAGRAQWISSPSP